MLLCLSLCPHENILWVKESLETLTGEYLGHLLPLLVTPQVSRMSPLYQAVHTSLLILSKMAFTQANLALHLTWLPWASFLPIWPLLVSPSLDLTDFPALFPTIFFNFHAYPTVWTRGGISYLLVGQSGEHRDLCSLSCCLARLCLVSNSFRLLENNI